MNTFFRDVQYGLRMLGKSPAFTAVAVVTLALGIGANTGIFSITQQVLLQRLPVPHPEQLVLLYSPGPQQGHVESDESDGSESFSYPMYKDLRDHNTILAGLAAKFSAPVSVAFRGQTERASSDLVSGNFFDVLGVRATIGRIFAADDTPGAGANPVVMLGYGFWKRRFGGDTGLLNQSLLVNNQPMTVVGIVQPGFEGIQLGRVPDLYIPITMKAQITPNWNGLDNRKDYWVKLIGRLKPGISRTQAEAGLLPAYHAILENDLPLYTGWNDQRKKEFLAKAIILRDGSKGRPIFQNGNRQGLLTLMGMVGLVLFIACANVAGLLTARGAARQREICVRLSLGASRWRLIRQLVVESCLLSIAGALLGLLIASWTSDGLVRFAMENEDAQGLSSALSVPVLLFAMGLALVCGIAFGVAPALRATRVELAATLKDQAGSLSAGLVQARLRKGLVISQVALTLLLVTAAAGFARSLYNLQHVDLGLRPSHVLQFSVEPELNGYNPLRAVAFFRQLEERLAALPGVQTFSGATIPVLAGDDWGSNVTVEGEPPEKAGNTHALRNAVGANYFSTMGIPLLAGREFTQQDTAESPKVVVINETMAKMFFPGRDPIGRHMKFGSGSSPLNIEIIGVVKDSKHQGVKEEVRPFVYMPYTQDPTVGRITYYIRTQQDPAAIAAAIRSTVAQLDANLPVVGLRSLELQIEMSISGDRLLAFLTVAFGILAALLAAMGIYGLLAYTVTQRTREIGVRMALGAEPRHVRRMILGDVTRLAGIGIVAGLPLAYGISRLTNSLLYNVKSFDVPSFMVALLALVLVASVAGYAPAWRATRVDPMVALRYE